MFQRKLKEMDQLLEERHKTVDAPNIINNVHMPNNDRIFRSEATPQPHATPTDRIEPTNNRRRYIVLWNVFLGR